MVKKSFDGEFCRSERFRRLVLRNSLNPTVPLLLPSRSAGHYRVDLGWEQHVIQRDFIELFWGISGEMALWRGAERHLLHEGEVFFYFPGDWHVQRALSKVVEYRFMTLDGDFLRDIRDAFRLPDRPFAAGPCPEALFDRLETELRGLEPRDQYDAGNTASTILHKALAGAFGESDENPLIHQFKELVARRYDHPDCSIDAFAEELGVHRGTLHRIFKRCTGHPPCDYLTAYRLREAMDLLRSTDLPIARVARLSGFSDPNYFAKIMRKRIGKAPGDFRRD